LASQRHPFEVVPLRFRWFKTVERLRDRSLACATDRKLHDQDRNAKDREEDQIEQHERRTAVFAHHVRKTPYVTQPDRATCADQDEP
jgi:hypothetical protein